MVDAANLWVNNGAVKICRNVYVWPAPICTMHATLVWSHAMPSYKIVKKIVKKKQTTTTTKHTCIHTYIMEMSPPPIITIKLELYNYGQNAYHSCLVLYWDCEYLTKWLIHFCDLKKKTNKKDIKLFLYSYCMTKLCKKICIQIKLVLIQWSF